MGFINGLFEPNTPLTKNSSLSPALGFLLPATSDHFPHSRSIFTAFSPLPIPIMATTSNLTTISIFLSFFRLFFRFLLFTNLIPLLIRFSQLQLGLFFKLLQRKRLQLLSELFRWKDWY